MEGATEDASVKGERTDEELEPDLGLSEEAMAAQREAEAELGDVTAAEQVADLGDNMAAPTLLTATAAQGGDDSLVSKDASAKDKKNQLDTLLNKAQQYSEFIRSSQETAEQTFDEHAARQAAARQDGAAEDDEADEPAEGSGTKRKKKGGGKSKKKKAKVSVGEMKWGTLASEVVKRKLVLWARIMRMPEHRLPKQMWKEMMKTPN